MGGGLFGSQKSSTQQQIPAYIEDASKEALTTARGRNQVGYVPYMGPEVAAMTPMQMASMNGANTMASALGLATAPITMPTPTDYGNGISGYGSYDMMRDNLARLQETEPEIYNALLRFADPASVRPTGVGTPGLLGTLTGDPSRPYTMDKGSSGGLGSTMHSAPGGQFGGITDAVNQAVGGGQPKSGGLGGLGGFVGDVFGGIGDFVSDRFSDSPLGEIASNVQSRSKQRGRSRR